MARVAPGLSALGLGRGDRLLSVLQNRHEAWLSQLIEFPEIKNIHQQV